MSLCLEKDPPGKGVGAVLELVWFRHTPAAVLLPVSEMRLHREPGPWLCVVGGGSSPEW